MSIDFCFFLIFLRKYAKVLYLALSDDEALQVTGSGSELLLWLLCLLFLCCFIDYAKKIDQSHRHKTNYYHCTDLRYYILSILLENLSRSDKTKDKSIIGPFKILRVGSQLMSYLNSTELTKIQIENK